MIKNFFIGLSAYGRALQLIRSLGLWSYFLIPALISIVLAGIIFTVAWNLGDDLGRWLIDWYPWEAGAATVAKAGTVIGSIIIIILGLILYKNLVMAFASPFMSQMSERIERRLSPHYEAASFSSARMVREIMRGLRIALRNISREIFFTVLLILIGLIPFFSPFVALAIFLVQSYYAGFGSMDYTLERHYSVRESIDFGRRYRGLALGIGAVFILLLMTGIGFLFALPLSTAAATPEVIKRLDREIV
ncbi:EI24 domain-containing protein [Flavilitoribacter nigricans]|uniref:Coproporphyrinogen III oxidase n=1 Tax=Flavilitoribacter nigricans (strain ATCC 23147 / DSM 23189 / NBRC 102662 / NCIMB 1420 / SS-2) TaxID=1122177 RepID=A0A2D0NGC8_FLAN2|nr:EI24 domain-containing protein [Flavilitoribacter nigricans]PHN07551.1 coproporphyrinogen III oxidase [Flavilitoribacter nigricans DSM 23189 = NBRC 102662]